MPFGSVIDYIYKWIEENKDNSKGRKSEKAKVRKANQSDFDAF